MEIVELINLIDNDFNSRRKELSDHLALLKIQTDEKYIISLSNTGFVLLYAHVQGFIENILTKIEGYIINSGIHFNDLNNNLKYQCLVTNKDPINELIKIVLEQNNIERIQIFKKNNYQNIYSNDHIRTTNGLDYSMIKEFLKIFGIGNKDLFTGLNIDYLTISFFQNKSIGAKDPSLLNNDNKDKSFEYIFNLLKDFRNNIAHGKAEKVRNEILQRRFILTYYSPRNELKLDQEIYAEFFNLFVDIIYDKLIMSTKEALIDIIIKEDFKSKDIYSL